MLHRPALLFLFAAVACKSDQDLHRRSNVDVFYQEPSNEVDVLWVVDNSLSMEDEQAEVGARFGDFITSVEDSGLDFHIGVITTDMDASDQRGQLIYSEGEPVYLEPTTENYIELFERRVMVGTAGADREKGIDAALTALTEPLTSTANEGFLRQGATLSVIYVSDENDCTDRGALNDQEGEGACYEKSHRLTSVRDLITEYDRIKFGTGDRMLVSAIVGPEIVENCDGAVPGFRYLTMAEAYGGIGGSICEEDFSGIMENLGLQASGMLTSFQLSEHAMEGTIEVFVDEQGVIESDSNGWTYDDTYAILYFHGDAVPPRGSTITVQYDIGG